MKRVLIVCTGNVCRSPMMAGLLATRLETAGLADRVSVASAGVHALTGQPASAPGVELLAAKGIDIGGHRARPLLDHDVQRADLILAMEEAHRRAIFYRSPSAMHKVVLASELVGEHDDIPDPYGGDRRDYIATLARLERVLDQGWYTLLRQLRLP